MLSWTTRGSVETGTDAGIYCGQIKYCNY